MEQLRRELKPLMIAIREITDQMAIQLSILKNNIQILHKEHEAAPKDETHVKEGTLFLSEFLNRN